MISCPPALRRTAVVVLLAATGLPLAACGGSGEPAASWVGTFCGAGSGVRTVLSGQNDGLRAILKIPDLQPADLKQSIVRGADSMVTASATAGARIRDEEQPKVAQGEEIQAAAVAKYAEIDTRIKALQVQAQALDPSSKDTLVAGIGPYSQGVADASRDVAGSFKELQQFKGYAKLEKASQTPDDYGTVQTCTKLQTVAS